MALFSRRKPSNDAPPPRDEPAPAIAEPSAAGEPAASIGISISSYTGLGQAPAPPAPPEPAAAAPEPARPPRPALAPADPPPASETVPGLRDNAVLAGALARLEEPPTPAQLIGVVRQLLQGTLYLRVKGDVRQLLAEGRDLPLAIATHNGRQFVLVYSGGTALQAAVRADGETGTSAFGQPSRALLRHIVSRDYAGVIVDAASRRARAVIPRDLIHRALDEAGDDHRVKELLCAPRTDATPDEVVSALLTAKLWIGVNRTVDGSAVGVAEVRSADGTRYLQVFTHPLEVAALDRGDRALPITVPQLATAIARDEAMTGIAIDSAGPSLRLNRAQLGPLLALAP